MLLSELLQRAGLDTAAPAHEIEIAGVTDSSGEVAPGWLFVAIPGVAVDGHGFIPEAVRKGAAAVLGSQDSPAGLDGTPYVRTAAPRRALALLLHAFHGFPMRDMLVVGITGTNGKSTTAYLVESILAAAGRKTGLVGTVEYRYGQVRDVAAHTTPHPLVLVRYASEMRQAGVDALVMEVSSHALTQDRVLGIPFRVGVLTNVTQDHFDYHQTREAYIEAKWTFFGEVLPRQPGGVAVFNLDDEVGRAFHHRYTGPALTYGCDPAAALRATGMESDPSGIRFTLAWENTSYDVRSQLCGDYNVANVLAALAAGVAAGVPMETVLAGVEDLAGVPGRFERVHAGAPFEIYVDFAHTPAALDHMLASARRLVGAGGRLLCIFGAGGNRDQSKRGPMGAAVARYADRAIITKDNCRLEDPARIAAALAAGIESVPQRRGTYDIILDRREAIRTLLAEARPGDLVMIAGKGHELYEYEAGEMRPWDDRREIREILRQLTGL